MKTAKRNLAVLLSFVMMLSGLTITSTKAKAAATACTYFISIGAPYESYYSTTNAEKDRVTLDEKDISDDFGIGLPTDGSDATVDDGGETRHYTAIRAIAKYIRNYLIDTKAASTKEEANALMPKYINYAGGFISGFSTDGSHWNTGAFSDMSVEGTSDDGYWAFYTNGMSSSVGAGTCSLPAQDYGMSLEFKWSTYTGEGYQASKYAFIGDKSGGFGLAKDGVKGTLYQRDFTFDPTTYEITKFDDTAVTGAAVTVYDSTGMEYTHTFTDEKGNYEIKDMAPGIYSLVAQKDKKDAKGRTFSEIARAGYDVVLADTPKTPSSVKASGKKGAINVTWKASGSKLKLKSGYTVYVSKKKNSGYKSAGSKSAKKATIKKSKGTYYVKVRQFFKYTLGVNEDTHVKKVYGAYSKPVKVTVK